MSNVKLVNKHRIATVPTPEVVEKKVPKNIKKAMEETKSCEADLNEARTVINNHEQTIAQLNGTNEELSVQNADLYMQLDASTATADEAYTGLKAAKERIAEVEPVLGELAKANAEANVLIKELKAENKKLKFNQQG